MNSSDAKKQYLVCFLIMCSPFLFFYWMIPFLTDATIGGDYLSYSLRQQAEFNFSIKTGSFPLFVPGFAFGHSSIAMTLGGILHPLSFVASIMPGYWDGQIIDVNNLLKLLSLGLTHLIIYVFLQKLKLNKLSSFFISLITIYNLRMIHLYQAGTSLEAYTGYLVLIALIGLYFISRSKWINPICIILATCFLVVSGHAEEMYYGLLGAGLFTLIAPYYITSVRGDKQISFNTALKFWFFVGICLCLGILLSSFYVIPFYFDFLSLNVDRVGRSYEWANSYPDTLIGTINNFFFPLMSQVHGAFGGSSLIILVFIIPVLQIFKFKIPRSIWIVWVLLLLMFLHVQGDRTPVHRLVWQYLPFASSIRVAGRISIIMPAFIMLLLAWLVQQKAHTFKLRRFSFILSPLSFLSCIAVFMILSYYLLTIDAFRPYYPYNFHFMSYGLVQFIVVMCGVISLILLAMYSYKDIASKAIGILLIVTLFIQLGVVLRYRSVNWTQNSINSTTYTEMREQKKKDLDYLYYSGVGMSSSIVNTQLTNSFMEPFLGKIFSKVEPVKSIEDAYKAMRNNRLPQQVFIEGYDSEKARIITEKAMNMKGGSVELVYSSFNRLQFKVSTDTPAIFGLSYPYTGHWKASVNGKNAHVYRANGAAHAVELSKGENLIEFRYWSNAFFGGMVISCLTFAIIGLFVSFCALKGIKRFTVVVIVLIITVGGFLLWYNSLYNGDNLETEYRWKYSPPLETPNLAYGKKNWLSTSAVYSNWDLPHARWIDEQVNLSLSRFVDGERAKGSGFSTLISDRPKWFLDLNGIEEIKKIVLYESTQIASMNSVAMPFPDQIPLANVRPLQIALSKDGVNWITVQSVVAPIDHNGPTSIVFDKSHTARFIKITATGKSKLSFDEVEVFGP